MKSFKESVLEPKKETVLKGSATQKKNAEKVHRMHQLWNRFTSSCVTPIMHAISDGKEKNKSCWKLSLALVFLQKT